MNTSDNGIVYLICSLITTILCIILKIPQLIAIIKTKSTHGINIQSLILEFWAYLTMLSYSYANSYPFAIYSEYPFLVLQDLILIVMILLLNKSLNVKWISAILVICSIHLSVGLRIVPMYIAVIFLQIGAPIAWYSKALQCWTIVSNKNAGQVSAMTWTMNSIATAARLISLLLSIWDKLVMTSLAVSFILNSSVAIAAHVYRQKTKKE